jgi:hypothetical protein
MGKVIACKIEVTGVLSNFMKTQLVYSGQTIPIEASTSVNFFLDESCFSDRILSPEAKWAFIYERFYSSIEDAKGKQNDLWADIGGGQNEFIDVKGIGKQYKKDKSFSISPAGTNYYYGFKQRVVVFTENADQEFHFFIVPYMDTPSISYAYFNESDKIRRYGDAMNLQLSLHQYPDSIHKKGRYEAVVYLLEKKDALKAKTTDEFNEYNVLGKPIQKNLRIIDYTKEDSINNLINIDFIIDIAWRKEDREDKKTFTPVIEVYETIEKEFAGMVPYDSKQEPIVKNFALEPTQNLSKYNSKILGMEALQKEKNSVYSEFSVSNEAMSEFLDRKELEKNNMIQYIGDISYTKKENNPCAYSVITINEGTRTVTIFDENQLADKVNDTTSNTFDIVAGDKEKTKVTVTAKFKKDKKSPEESIHIGGAYMCESLLNDGHKHEKPTDVFKMDYIVGQWKPLKDFPGRLLDGLLNFSSFNSFRFYHPDNGKNAPVLKTADPYQKQYAAEQDAKGIPHPTGSNDQFKEISVAAVQGLTASDYKIEKDTITLELGYVYNRVYENKIAAYLGTQEVFEGGMLSKNVKNAWVVRYLLKLIYGEQIYQTYFVPVTTCRYPNQIAKINVYPDMKWVFNFNYNIKTPIYYKPTPSLVDHYADSYEGRNVHTSNSNTRLDIREQVLNNYGQIEEGRKTSFTLGVECEVSGEDDVISLSKEMGEKYRKMLSPLLSIVTKLDNDLGVSEARTENNNIRTAGNRGILARLQKLPMSFTIEAPNIGVGLGIGFAGAKSGRISYELEGRVVADPLIGANVKLDILALGSKLKPWGLILDALDIASWAANFFSGGKVEIDYKVEVRFTAQIKLIGKKNGTDPKTKKPTYEGFANARYNFGDKKFKFDGGIEGKILGEIEISASVKILAKVKDAYARVPDEKKKVAEAGVGAKASSHVELKCPFEIKDGGMDIDVSFSGVVLEVWFKASLNPNDDDGKPNFTKSLLPKIDFTKKIQF